jgi:hypothetical protein
MAAKLLLPGFGGRTTITLSDTDTSDTYDMSLCESFAAVLTDETGTSSVQPEQSFDGANWATLGSALASEGNTLKQDHTDGPHGLIRFVQTGSGSAVITLVGFPLSSN